MGIYNYSILVLFGYIGLIPEFCHSRINFILLFSLIALFKLISIAIFRLI
jgi:hypothetical protein